MKIAFKPEVRLVEANLTLSSTAILGALIRTAPAMQGDVIVITSAADGTHGLNSLHPKGFAFDVRIYGTREGAVKSPFVPGMMLATMQRAEATGWVGRLRAELGRDYDVVLESDHIHVEYDPK